MRYGRQQNKNRYTFFDESVEMSVRQELHIETGIKSALEANELYLNYQPIVNTQTGKVTSFEALVRWKSALWGGKYTQISLYLLQSVRSILLKLENLFWKKPVCL